MGNLIRNEKHKVVFLFFIISLLFYVSTAYASVDMGIGDFGEVIIGTASTKVITITNLDQSNSVMINFMLSGTACGFSVLAQQGMMVDPGQTAEVEIQYQPQSLGTCTGTLNIFYSAGTYEVLNLSGTGVEEAQPEEPQVEPQEEPNNDEITMGTVLKYFDEAVKNGDLEGRGPGKSAKRRLHLLRKKLVKADRLIERGKTRKAIRLLKSTSRKLDGEGRRHRSARAVFAKGEAVSELSSMIKEIIQDLKTT